MNVSDFNKFLTGNSVQTGNWKVYYDFSKISGDAIVINALYDIDTQYSGGCVFVEKNPGFIVGLNSGGFNDYEGSGFFSGNSILRVSNYLNEPDWTMFLTYKNTGCQIDKDKSTILISNQTNLSDTSGFCFGFNGANKFFIEYNNLSGKNTYTSSYEGKNNTCISLSKNLNIFELSVHDFANSENTRELFNLDNYVNSNIYYLGNTYNNDVNYTGFKGYMDDFLYFSGYIGYEQRNNLAGGIFCSSITPASTTTIISGFNKISSGLYATGAVIGTGITGYQSVVVGSIPTKAGGSIQICTLSGITGLIYGQQIQFITGSITGSKRISVTTPEIINYDFNRLKNYANNRLKLLYPIDNFDFVEINTYTGFLDNYREVTNFDYVLQQFVLGLDSTGQNINLFNNGVLQISGTNISGNIVSGNYVLSGNRYVNSNGFFEQFVDKILYFDITNTPQIIQYTGTGNSYTLNNSSNNSMYLNGQKLISGLNYSINGPNINFSGNITATGQILATARTNSLYDIFTGDYRALTGNINPLTEEQVYLNGILQMNNKNYIKTTCQSLLNSLFYPSVKQYNYYNNDENFFNLL